MPGLFGSIGVIGFAGVVVALLALVRGRMRWARITNRKAAAIMLAASFSVFVAGSAIAGATSTTQPNGSGPSAPVTTTVTPTPSPTTETATTSSPVVTQYRTVQVTTTVPKPRVTTIPTTRTTTVPPPPPSISLTCVASMSNTQPADDTRTDVIVLTGVAGAQVTATAHYKTTDTSHSTTGGADGTADIPYYISRATPGYTVEVDVTVVAQGMSRSCATSFTPR